MEYDLGDDDLRNDDALDTGPTFEDLAIDDSLSDLDRVTKYICSNIALQRVIHAKMLSETATSVGFQATCDHLIPLLGPLVDDVEYVVRQHVALQFPPLSQFLVSAGQDAGYRVLLDKMIPLVSKLVSDKQHEVRSAASDSLVELAALVKAEDQGQHILTIVLPLAHDDDNEQFRISAVTLYHGLAEHLGPELCQQFCVPELISLSEDPVFRVRKSTAQSFASVCRTAGQELSRERLLPAFQRLAHDDIWAVRKACAECLVSISEALALSDRGELLIPLLEVFLADSSRWVRMAAFQSLGPFLASLAREDVSEPLLQHFLGMATNAGAAQPGGEVDMKFHCAFNFPAIVSIVGATAWHQLASTFETLSQDSFWKIRRTFAYSLHELAQIVGTDIAETQLATAFDTYLRDVPDVKMGVMVHFADFLQHVSPSFRESYLPVLSELLQGLSADHQGNKWRTREIMSLQLPQLCSIFSPEATYSVIYPLVQQLLTDDVAVVRHQSVRACPLLIARLSHRPEWRDAVVATWTALASAPCFIQRQVFVRVCQAFITESEETGRAFFTDALATSFFALAHDGISNVRVVFAQVLLAHQDVLFALPSCPVMLRDLATTHSTAEGLMCALGPHSTPPADPQTSDVAVVEVASVQVEVDASG